MALRGTKSGETQVVVANGLARFDVVCIRLRFKAFCKALVLLVRAHEMKKSLFLAPKHP